MQDLVKKCSFFGTLGCILHHFVKLEHSEFLKTPNALVENMNNLSQLT